jgi:PIN domain nuclease of toxin-antitoxin system
LKLLLDTHVWIWTLGRPDRLGRNARRALENPSNQVYLSPISIWEIYHLAERRRFRPTGTFQEWLKLTLSKTTFLEAPFDFAVATEVSQIHLPQPDLGDVFLAATAVAFDLTLVTADSQLLACKWLKTLSAD